MIIFGCARFNIKLISLPFLKFKKCSYQKTEFYMWFPFSSYSTRLLWRRSKEMKQLWLWPAQEGQERRPDGI